MRRHWFSILLTLSISAIVVLGGWYIRTRIVPYSTRYGRGNDGSTTPVGVESDQSGSTTPDAGRSAEASMRSVLLVPVTVSGKASTDYSAGISFRVDVVGSDGNVVYGPSVTVTLTTTSTSAQFDGGAALVIPSGQLSQLVRYRDTLATRSRVGAFVSGLVGSSLELVTFAGPPARLSPISPAVSRPAVGAEVVYGVSALDDNGNVTAGGDVSWSLVGSNGGSSTSTHISASVDATGQSHFRYTADSSDLGGHYTLSASMGGSSQSIPIEPHS
jgi:hypothetical protein